MVLSASEKGKTRLRAIPRGFLVAVGTKVRRYQELRRDRVRLIEVHGTMEVAGKCRRLRRELNGVMRNPRAP